MQNYPPSSAPPQQPPSLEPAKEEEPSMAGYFLHWLALALAVGINIGAWAVDYYAVKRQYSYYYYNPMTFATTIDATQYTNAATMFSPDDPTDTISIVMALAYSWILWKVPLVVYALHLTA